MAKRDFQKQPLYRKVNTRARGVHHNSGPDFRHLRNTKSDRQLKAAEASRGKLRQGAQRGLDYTPLVRFLLSRVGQRFADIHSEAVARLDREEPIFWFVARTPDEAKTIVNCGESSYYSGMFVDDAGILQLVDPGIDIRQMWPTCPCCTHTFNGDVFPNKYDENRRYSIWKDHE